jgi:predicted HD phosphohydrolase
MRIIKEVQAEDFGNTEDEMTVGRLLENIQVEPLTKLHHAFLMAGRAEMTALTRECQEAFIAAVFASDAGKAVANMESFGHKNNSPVNFKQLIGYFRDSMRTR